jgi:hypothetical protein
MDESQAIIAHLKAQVIIEETRAKVLRQWVYNQNHLLQADVCDKMACELRKQISERITELIKS